MFEYVRCPPCLAPCRPGLCLALTQRQLWKVEANGEERNVEYLATLSKHTQAVNVVRWAPKGEPARWPRAMPHFPH